LYKYHLSFYLYEIHQSHLFIDVNDECYFFFWAVMNVLVFGKLHQPPLKCVNITHTPSLYFTNMQMPPLALSPVQLPSHFSVSLMQATRGGYMIHEIHIHLIHPLQNSSNPSIKQKNLLMDWFGSIH